MPYAPQSDGEAAPMRRTSPASGLELFTAPKTLSMFLLGGVALGVLVGGMVVGFAA
jgi:hypothetical protein